MLWRAKNEANNGLLLIQSFQLKILYTHTKFLLSLYLTLSAGGNLLSRKRKRARVSVIHFFALFSCWEHIFYNESNDFCGGLGYSP